MVDARMQSDIRRKIAPIDYRAAMSDALSGIIDRDHFLQRLTRKVADITGVSRVAMYTRVNDAGDLLIRASTFPSVEIVAARIPPAENVTLTMIPLVGQAAQHALTVPIGDGRLTHGALVLHSEPGMTFGAPEIAAVSAIAEEIAPAVAVAELHHAVKQSSVVDLTTGTHTAWFVNQRLEEEVARSQRTMSPVTLVLLKVLGFGAYRQAVGFERGDQMLHDLAAVLSALTRSFDVIGARASAEYVVLLPDADLPSADAVTARILQRSKRLLERMRAESGVRLAFISAAASFPTDGERASTIEMVADQRLQEQESQQQGAEAV